MMRARDLPDMVIIAAREARVTANHPTNLPSSLTKTNNRGTASSTIIRIETRVGMTMGMETVVVAIVALGVDSLALPATGVMGFSTIYMGPAIGRINALLNLSARFVVDPM